MDTLKRIPMLLLFCLFQVWVANKIALFGYATPLLYLYPLLRLPVHISRNSLLLHAFFIGLFIDVFSNTPGMHASAATAIALLRPILLGFFVDKNVDDNLRPSIATLRFGSFSLYVVIAVALHHLLFFTVQTFMGGDLLLLLYRFMASCLLTSILILLIDLLRGYQQK